MCVLARSLRIIHVRFYRLVLLQVPNHFYGDCKMCEKGPFHCGGGRGGLQGRRELFMNLTAIRTHSALEADYSRFLCLQLNRQNYYARHKLYC